MKLCMQTASYLCSESGDVEEVGNEWLGKVVDTTITEAPPSEPFDPIVLDVQNDNSFFLPIYSGSEVWEGIWIHTHLVVLNFCLEEITPRYHT